jgi:hypothetical protein
LWYRWQNKTERGLNYLHRDKPVDTIGIAPSDVPFNYLTTHRRGALAIYKGTHALIAAAGVGQGSDGRLR